jgi:hypothetical protein
VNKTWKLKRTTQCGKCPWRMDVDPHEIPEGYSEAKHRDLGRTIAEPGRLNLGGTMRVMACHETENAHCLGWLMHQIGAGNNIGLRLQMMSCENTGKIRLIGDQHQMFEDTLPDQEE